MQATRTEYTLRAWTLKWRDPMDSPLELRSRRRKNSSTTTLLSCPLAIVGSLSRLPTLRSLCSGPRWTRSRSSLSTPPPSIRFVPSLALCKFVSRISGEVVYLSVDFIIASSLALDV